MKALRYAAVAAALTMTLAACGSDDEMSEAEKEALIAEAMGETQGGDEAEEATSDNCLTVSTAMLNAIAEGADGATLKPTAGAAYRSDDFENVYMIAMRFDGLGSPEEGVWASNSLTPGDGLIMSVDGMAQEFTVWPNGTADSPMSVADHGADEALDCLP